VLFSSARLEGIFGFRLKTITNETFPLAQLARNKASVIVFLLPDCPACESYSKTLTDLSKKFKDSGFEFYGVFPGTYNTTEEMIAFQKLYKVEFPLLQDPENLLARSLSASVVPSVFLINNLGEVLYKGRIDDWLYALGKKRAVITKHDLKNAMQSFKDGKIIQVRETTPIGCILEY
jgi:peroxiredoxin